MLTYNQFLTELSRVREEKQSNIAEIEALHQKMLEEIEEARARIIKKYNPKFRPFRQVVNKDDYILNQINDDFGYYTLFRTEQINDIFTSLLMFVEGERFISLYNYNGNFKGAVLDYTNHSIIIKESALDELVFLDDNKLKELVANGNAVILADAQADTVHLFSREGIPYFNFGQYDYLNDFLKFLVQERINIAVKQGIISKDLLDAILLKYLLKNKDLYLRNKDKRNKMFKDNQNGLDPRTNDITIPLCMKMNAKYQDLSK